MNLPPYPRHWRLRHQARKHVKLRGETDCSKLPVTPLLPEAARSEKETLAMDGAGKPRPGRNLVWPAFP